MAKVITYDQVAPLATEWLWDKRIPLGDLTLMFGEGGCGKGRMLIDLAARVTRGDGMPLCADGDEPGSVVLILPEDDPHEQVAPRLHAAGADLGRCFDLTRLEGGSRFKLSADGKTPGPIGHLRALIDQLRADGMNPRLVIIDPLAAVLGAGTINTNQGARRLVEPLQDLAKNCGIAIMAVAHTVKSGQLQGSAGLPQTLRTVYRISRDPDNVAQRRLGLDKSNNLPEMEDVRYTITEDQDGRVVVKWLDRAALDAQRQGWRDELAARRARKEPPAAPGRPKTSAMTYRAVMTVSGRGTTMLGKGIADERFARMLCEATPHAMALGTPLLWAERRPGVWMAGNQSCAFAVAVEGASRAAV